MVPAKDFLFFGLIVFDVLNDYFRNPYNDGDKVFLEILLKNSYSGRFLF